MLITDTYINEILRYLYCYDRININATAGTFGYTDGMTQFFYSNNFRIFSFSDVFTSVTKNIIENAEKIRK
jgi:hypothetical protein